MADDLTPDHREILHGASGVSLEVIWQRGYRSVSSDMQEYVRALGYKPYFRGRSALHIPLHDVDGNVHPGQLRFDVPPVIDGKPLRYASPPGVRPMVDVPPQRAGSTHELDGAIRMDRRL